MTTLDIQIETRVTRTGTITLNEAELLALITKALGDQVPHDLSTDNLKWDVSGEGMVRTLTLEWKESEPPRVQLQEVLL